MAISDLYNQAPCTAMPIDYSKYPSNWHTEIRPSVLARAQDRCEFCNAINYQPHPDTGSKVVLTIAHLDHDETNHDVSLDRLRALCQRCHLRYDAPEKARRRWAKREQGQYPIFHS